MKKYILLIAINILLLSSIKSQVTINGYEYWYDNAYSGKVATTLTSPSSSFVLQSEFPTSNLANGLHTFNIRFKDSDGKYSSTFSQFFQKLPTNSSATNNIKAYEYWVDNNYVNKTNVSLSSNSNYNLADSLNMSSIANGLHTIHFRFQDERGQWSSVLSQFFQKLPSQVSNSNRMTAYEYWVDNNYSAKVLTSVSANQTITLIDSIALASISNGLHTIHFRFKDSRGQWSSVLSQFFQKLPSQLNAGNKLTAYEYWVDNNYSGKILTNVTSTQNFSLIDSLNFSSLANGLHTIHIRFKDSRGQWSSVLSQFFQKLPSQIHGSNPLTTYEYWFDDNFAGKTTTSITPNQTFSLVDSLALFNLPVGLHIVHIRFKDSRGLWSGVISQFIQKLPASEGITENKIGAYRYWFDDNLETTQNVSLKTPVASARIDTLLNISFIPKGSHIIHFQFKDLIGYWSSVTSDSVYKYATPVASFTQDKDQFCDSSLVAFTNTSFDADTIISWNFGDGDTSMMQHPTHNFNKSGVYPITLIAGDKETGITDTIYSEVRVGDTPYVNLGKDTAICFGNTITLDAQNQGYTYLWNDQSTSRAISAKDAGIYRVTVTGLYNCANQDSVQISVNQLPVVDLGKDTAICDGTTLVLDAKNPSSLHLWNDNSVSQTLSVTSQGDYSVKVTDSNTCVNSDTIRIDINPTPIVDLGNDTTDICDGSTIVLDAQNSGAAYKWNNQSLNKTVEVGVEGKYYVTVTNAFNCKGSDSVYVRVNPLPLINLGKDTILNSSYSLTLDAKVTGDVVYNWSTGEHTPTIDVNKNGTYSVVVTTQKGCSSTDSITVTIITDNGLPFALGLDELKVYPVPFHDKITVEWNAQQESETSFMLMDINGKVLQILNKVSVSKGVNAFEINKLDQYPPGTYLLSIKQGNQITMIKVIRD